MSDLTLALKSRAEGAGLNASATPQQPGLDGWLLRFCPGQAHRARCVNALSGGRLPPAERLERCQRAYLSPGRLPMVFRVTPSSQPVGLPTAARRCPHESSAGHLQVDAGNAPALAM